MYFIVSPIDTIPPKVSPPSYSAIITSQVTSPLTSPPSSYPAVLVGRSNNESKPKVPPPVPPRGTPKTKRGGASSKGATVFSEMLDSKLSARHAERNVFSRLCRVFSVSYASKELAFMSLFKTRRGSLSRCSEETFDSDGRFVQLKSFGKVQNEFLQTELFSSMDLGRSAVSENAWPSSSKFNCNSLLQNEEYFMSSYGSSNSVVPQIKITDDYCCIDYCTDLV